MKICLISWAPFHAGAEVAAERLAVGLQAAGHEVLVVLGTNGESMKKMRAEGIRCEFVSLAFTDKWHWWRYADARRKLLKILRREQPDIVHFNDLPTSQMAGQAVERMGIPRLCHHRFPFGGAAIDWLNKFGAERHLFVSAYLRDAICTESSALAVAPSEVVYDGLPLPAAPTAASRRLARERLQLPRDKVLVLFAGQIVERKGVADLLNAWQLLPSRAAGNAELLIVGDDLQNQGQYRKEMERLAQRLKSPARFFGFQSNLPEWLTAADCAVVPSHVEPLGNATLEAMAHCLPVIGCNVGGIPEMIVHDETGLLVPPHNPEQLSQAICTLVENQKMRQGMGVAGRDRCELKFSIDAHVENIVQQYEQVLEVRAECLTT